MIIIKKYLSGGLAIFLRLVSIFPSHIVRNFIYKSLGLKLAKKASIYSLCELRKPWNISIGRNSIVGERVMLDGRRGLSIGENVNISSGVWIWTLHHDYRSPTFSDTGGEVVINNRVWICSRATILPGVTIGEGAVVAAGAVVTQNVEPYTVVGGIPAKKIGSRPKNLTYTLDYVVPFI